MRRIVIIFLCGLIFICCIRAETLHVGNGHPLSSIKAALEKCVHGDSIIIHEGLYKEGNLIVTKSISLIGAGWPILDGEFKHEVISVKADHVLISGLSIRNSGHSSMEDMGGIKVYDSQHVRITGNHLKDNFFGIYLQYCKNSIISGNRIIASALEEQQIGNGIHCWKSDSLVIEGNDISGHRDGIYFEFVKGSIIWRNISYGNIRYGLHFMFSNDDAYIGNVFRHNGAGVAVMFTKNVKMYNNTFIDNWGDAAYGLLLKEISDAYVFNNRFVSNTSGVYMEGTNRIVFEKNLFKDNGWGLKIQASCMDNKLIANNFQRNTFDVSTNGSLVLNEFVNNYWDKYEGYDLDRDHVGDIPYRPLSLFSVIVEKYPPIMILYRSFIITLMDKSERIIPTLTPANFVDESPAMKAIPL